MKYIVTINGKNYEVEVERGQASVVRTTDSAAAVAQPAAPAVPVQSAPAPQQAAPANVAGEAVKAPMPGTILDIKVKAGTAVKRGDVILILEAMKMENEITAPRDGVVSQIAVAKGASVATGDVLAALQ